MGDHGNSRILEGSLSNWWNIEKLCRNGSGTQEMNNHTMVILGVTVCPFLLLNYPCVQVMAGVISR